MKKLFFSLIALLAFSAAALPAQDVTGNWQGTLTLPNGKTLRTIFVIAKDDGVLKTTFYSIDQGGQPLKAKSTTFTAPSVHVDLALIGGSYDGKLAADSNSIAGTFTQGGPLPLNLLRATKETAWEIPAPPAPPKLMAADADPSFDVATIKPNTTSSSMQALAINGRKFFTRASSLADLISFAYEVQPKQIVGAPDWVSQDRYDIEAVPDVDGQPSMVQLRVLIRKLIADRYKLTFHHDKKEMSAFVLSVGKNGSKLTPTQLNGPLPGIGFAPSSDGLTLNIANGTLHDFTGVLQSLVLDRPVVDETGLTGKFDFQIKFTPDDSQFNGHPPKLNGETPGADTAPSLFDAIQQQIGLKLEARKTPVDVLVIDHVEKPTAN